MKKPKKRGRNLAAKPVALPERKFDDNDTDEILKQLGSIPDKHSKKLKLVPKPPPKPPKPPKPLPKTKPKRDISSLLITDIIKKRYIRSSDVQYNEISKFIRYRMNHTICGIGNYPAITIKGGTGIGKTTIVRDICDKRGYNLVVITGSEFEKNRRRLLSSSIKSTTSFGKPNVILLSGLDGWDLEMQKVVTDILFELGGIHTKSKGKGKKNQRKQLSAEIVPVRDQFKASRERLACCPVIITMSDKFYRRKFVLDKVASTIDLYPPPTGLMFRSMTRIMQLCGYPIHNDIMWKLIRQCNGDFRFLMNQCELLRTSDSHIVSTEKTHNTVDGVFMLLNHYTNGRRDTKRDVYTMHDDMLVPAIYENYMDIYQGYDSIIDTLSLCDGNLVNRDHADHLLHLTLLTTPKRGGGSNQRRFPTKFMGMYKNIEKRCSILRQGVDTQAYDIGYLPTSKEVMERMSYGPNVDLFTNSSVVDSRVVSTQFPLLRPALPEPPTIGK